MNKTNSSMIRWWDLPAALMLLAAMVVSASRLMATGWTDELNIAQLLIALGVIAGLALGKSKFSKRVVAFFAIAYGIFFITWQLGTTISENIQWAERLTILINRLGIILFQLFNREPVQDSLLFLLFMSALYWVLGLHAGYTMVRYGNAWKAIIPAGLTIFTIHSFDPVVTSRTWYLAGYLFFALIFVARMSFLQRHNRWQQSRTHLPPHLGYDFVRFAVLVALIIVLFSWTAPALASALPAAQQAWHPIREFWDKTKDNFENAFASLRATVSVVSTVYGDSASLGFGNPLSQSLIFTVEPQESAPVGTRLYWRARTYDEYSDGRWLSTVNKTAEFYPQADELFETPETGRWLGTFKFTSATNPATLFVPPQPLWVDRPGEVEYTENPDGSRDISTFRAVPSLQRGQEYQAISSINQATIAELREAGEDYPDWVLERYLQLPDSITPRTKELAEAITEDFDNPYDKTFAITRYLRENIEYVDTLSRVPPREQDVVDWFLFDLQQGFCNYYSTAEIVMLRSIGIPARWAIGYAQGELQNETGESIIYVVRHSDAHAWPEVYFPGIGWVEFEPTVSQPAISRQQGGTADELAQTELDGDNFPNFDDQLQAEMEDLRQNNVSSDGEFVIQETSTPIAYYLIVFAISLFLLFVGWRMRTRINIQGTPIFIERAMIKAGIRPPKTVRRWARVAALPPLTKAYLEINRALGRLDRIPDVNDTPNERADMLGSVLPEALPPAHNLVHEYELANFSQLPADVEVANSAGKEIRNLSLKAYLQKLITRIQLPSRSMR